MQNQNYQSYFYKGLYTNNIDCTNCQRIWFMKCLFDLSPEEKSVFSKKISNLRNFSFIIYFLTSLVDFLALMYYTSSAGTVGTRARKFLRLS